MPQPDPNPLPRRDIILLPVISVLSVLLSFAVAELLARHFWVEGGRESCSVITLSGDNVEQPNCVSHLKIAEGPWVSYEFNECGYRTKESCGPKPHDTVRVVTMGTSIALGAYVPYDETFAARSSAALTKICRRPVEFQNMGSWGTLRSQVRRAAEARALKPDALVLLVAPSDLLMLEGEAAPNRPPRPGLQTGLQSIAAALKTSRAALVAQHYMLLNEAFFLQLCQRYGTADNFLSQRVSPRSKYGFSVFDSLMGELGEAFHGSNVPLFLMAIPNRMDAALVSSQINLPEVDPDAFQRGISEIAARHGMLSVDVLSQFRGKPHAERMFYPVDEHPAGAANDLFSRAIVRSYLDGTVPALSACAASARRPG